MSNYAKQKEKGSFGKSKEINILSTYVL